VTIILSVCCPKNVQHYYYYLQQCFDEVDKWYDDASGREKKLTKDDWAHGSLLIVNELLRCSNVEGEVCICF
jgi:FKBP12-rapamycin complex-associated protein